MKPGNPKYTLVIAKQVLKEKGYTYRQAAPAMGVCYQHLSEVLNGKRPSGRILRKISALSHRAQPATAPSIPNGETPTAG